MTPPLFWITVFSLILLPAIPLGSGPSVRLDDITPLVWLALACLGVVRVNLCLVNQWRLAFFAILAATIPVSITVGTFAGYDGSPADFIQIIRLAKYAGVYLMAVAYFSRCKDVDLALRRITMFGVVLFGIAVAQYFNFLGLNERYVEIVAPTQFETLVNDYPTPRPVGMIGNPNALGFLFVMLAVIAAYRARHSNTALLLVLVFAAGVGMTLSRGAMAGFVVGIGLYALRSIFPTTIPALFIKAFLAGTFAIAAYVTLFHTEIYEALTWRFVRAFQGGADASLAQRLENWGENLAIIKDHLLIGVGPLRRVAFEHSADNEWLLMLRSYGLIGTLALIGLLAVPTGRIQDERARVAAWAMILAIFIYMIPAAVFHSLALFPLVLVVLAAFDVTPPSTPAHAAFRLRDQEPRHFHSGNGR